MKTIYFICLLLIGSFTLSHAQLIVETEVPAPAVEQFQTSHPNLSQNIKISWYLIKSNSYPDKVLYKATYMNGTHFETWGYSQNGSEFYANFDYYHAKDADQQVISKVKAAYPNLAINRISSFSSTPYGIHGYLIRFEDKARYFSETGEENNINPWPKIEQAAFNDPANFSSVAPQPAAPKAVAPVSGKKAIQLNHQ